MQTTNGTSGGDTLGVVQGGLSLVSTTSAGALLPGGSSLVSISLDGTKVFFLSSAKLSPLDGDTTNDLYMKNLVTGETTLITTTSEVFAGYLAGDNRHLVFSSSSAALDIGGADGHTDTFMLDLQTGVFTQLSLGVGGVDANNNINFPGAFDPSGGRVLLTVDANNLGVATPGGQSNVYLKDLTTGAWTLLTTTSSGGFTNGHSSLGTLSADGNLLAFMSAASNLVAGDTNGARDFFVKNLTTGAVTRVSTDSAGVQGNGSPLGAPSAPQFSPDGRYVLFETTASNLVAGDTNGKEDIFIKDLVTGQTILVSSSGAGLVGDGDSTNAVFSPDGTKVLFNSSATNLVAGDTNGALDAFVKDLKTGAITRISVTDQGLQSAGGLGSASLFAPDGSIFFSHSGALVGSDNNASRDVYRLAAASGDPNQTYTIHGLGGNDTIGGGNGVDKLYGDDGDDRVSGGGGGDQLFGGAGLDRLDGGDGADRLDGGADNDVLIGGAGNDYMDGGTGADIMSGGDDNDVYIVDNTGDQTIETATGGFDVVRASVDWTLAANTESLEQQGSGDINGTGNALANNITGTSGNNTLDGGDGGDTLDGGAGNDRLIGGKGNDVMSGGSGADIFVVTHASIGATMLGGSLETDTVKDLSKAQGDKLDLSAIDADITTTGEQAFHLVGAFSRHPAELVLTYTVSTNITLLKLDVDGDGKADYQMKITGDVHLDSGGWIL
jgi:Tol biopolymer transport system component